MYTKDFGAQVKAAGPDGGLDEGQFDAIVSVFGNIDSVGDVVMPGAFKDDLERWGKSGSPIPVVWAHDWADPFSHIGHVVKAEETDAGLRITGQLDLENPKAQQVYQLLKGRRVTQFSFAYDIEDAAPGKQDNSDVYELRRLKVHEVGPCFKGANQETELLATKALKIANGAKAGRVLSTKNYDRLTKARDALTEVIEAATQDDEKTSVSPDTDLTEEPSQTDPVVVEDEELTRDGAEAKSDDDPVSVTRRALAVALITNLS